MIKVPKVLSQTSDKKQNVMVSHTMLLFVLFLLNVICFFCILVVCGTLVSIHVDTIEEIFSLYSLQGYSLVRIHKIREPGKHQEAERSAIRNQVPDGVWNPVGVLTGTIPKHPIFKICFCNNWQLNISMLFFTCYFMQLHFIISWYYSFDTDILIIFPCIEL